MPQAMVLGRKIDWNFEKLFPNGRLNAVGAKVVNNPIRIANPDIQDGSSSVFGQLFLF
jgi:hypothetical protein